MIYLIDATPDDNGALLGTSKAFPELTTFGTDAVDLARNAVGALKEAIAARSAARESIPPQPSYAEIRNHKGIVVKLSLMTALKVELYQALKESGTTRAALARRLGWHREQVDRLFRIDHASRLDRLEAAFHALHRDVDVRIGVEREKPVRHRAGRAHARRWAARMWERGALV